MDELPCARSVGVWRNTGPHFADDDLDVLRRRHERQALQLL